MICFLPKIVLKSHHNYLSYETRLQGKHIDSIFICVKKII